MIRLAICAAGELYGGVERFVSTFTEYLRDNTDIEFVVVLFYEGELARQLRAAGIETMTVIPCWKYDPMVVRRLVKLFKARRIRVVHTHGYMAAILASVAGKRCGARTIHTEHGRLEPRSCRDFRWLRMRCSAAVCGFVVRRYVDHVVYVTEDLRNSLGRADGEQRCSVIYNGIPPISVKTDPDCTDIDSDKFNIGVV